MEQPGVGGDWSMKDIVAHLTAWNRWIVARMRAGLRGEPAPSPDWSSALETDDEVNGWIYESYRGRSMAEVLEETDLVNQQLVEVIRELPDSIKIEFVEPSF